MKLKTRADFDAAADYLNQWERRIHEDLNAGRNTESAEASRLLHKLAWNAFKEAHNKAHPFTADKAPAGYKHGFTPTPAGFYFVD